MLAGAAGVVDINAATRGQLAWGDEAEGGFFTSSLLRHVDAVGRLTWREVMSRVSADTSSHFKRMRRQSPKEFGTQTDQVPQVFRLEVREW